MPTQMRHCCVYTLAPVCPQCGGKTKTAHPAPFKQGDRYGKYRRAAKSQAS